MCKAESLFLWLLLFVSVILNRSVRAMNNFIIATLLKKRKNERIPSCGVALNHVPITLCCLTHSLLKLNSQSSEASEFQICDGRHKKLCSKLTPAMYFKITPNVNIENMLILECHPLNESLDS